MKIDDLPEEVLLLIFDQLPSFAILQIASTCKRWNAIINEQTLWKRRCQREFSTKAILSVRNNKEPSEDMWKITYCLLAETTKKQYYRLKEINSDPITQNCLLSDSELQINAAVLTGNTALIHLFLAQNQLHLNNILDLDVWDVFGEKLLAEERHRQSGYEPLEKDNDKYPCLLDFICLHQQQSVLDALYMLSVKEAPDNPLFWAIVCNQTEHEIKKITNESQSNFTQTLSIPGKNNYEAHPFELAAIFGHFELFKFLLSNYADKSFVLIREALAIAVYRGNVDIVTYLQAYFTALSKEDVNLFNYLIEVASSHGDIAILQVLLGKHSTPTVVQKAFRAAVCGNCHFVLEALYKDYTAIITLAFLNEMLFETKDVTDPRLVLRFLFDKGANVFICDTIYGTVEDFVEHKEQIKNMILCEMKIQSVLKILKRQVEENCCNSGVNVSYFVSALTSFFQPNLGYLLKEAYELDPIHYAHRLTVLVANESSLYDRKIITKLVSLTEFAPREPLLQCVL